MVRTEARGERRGGPSSDLPSSLAWRPAAAPTSHTGGAWRVWSATHSLKARTSAGCFCRYSGHRCRSGHVSRPRIRDRNVTAIGGGPAPRHDGWLVCDLHLGSDDPPPARPVSEFVTVGQLEFPQHRRDMGLDRLVADVQAARHLLVGEAAGDQAQYLLLTVGQLIQLGVLRNRDGGGEGCPARSRPAWGRRPHHPHGPA